MQFILMVLKGIFIGISNIIPGVSGGTMAVSFGIYDELIHSVTHVRKEFRRSMKFLSPLIVGILIGAAGFSYIVELLLDRFTLITSLSFIGLILGGLPIIWLSFKAALAKERKTINSVHWIIFMLSFLLVAWMGIADVSGGTVQEVNLEVTTLVILFLVGMVSGAALVIPGVSGSLLLLILGYYYAFLYIINGFTSSLRHLDVENLIVFTLLCAIFGIGMLLGLGGISKGIDLLFKYQPGYTYASILGLVLASPIAILVNTEALTSIQLSNDFLHILSGIVIGSICLFVTYFLGKSTEIN